MDDREELMTLGDELFGSYANIPPTYLRQVKHHITAATARLGLPISSEHREVYWIDGRSLGALVCKGLDDTDLHDFRGMIWQLDHVTVVALEVVTVSNAAGRSSGRRLAIELPGHPKIILDASPGRFMPEKRTEIEAFVDKLLAALAGRA